MFTWAARPEVLRTLHSSPQSKTLSIMLDTVDNRTEQPSHYDHKVSSPNLAVQDTMENEWTPRSWRSKPIKQEVAYEDNDAANRSLDKLKTLPPLVHPKEISNLRRELKDVAAGKAFLLQGGDCAELFDYCRASSIDAKMKLLLQMSLVLIWGTNRRCVVVGRMAGQYAKPRSSLTEKVDDKEVPTFRGDILNGNSIEERRLDPERLVSAYFHSSTTLSHIRTQLRAGFTDLQNHMDWDLGHVSNQSIKERYLHITSNITESLRFMKTIGAAPRFDTINLYTSHEALVLPYEESLTRCLNHPRSRGLLEKPHTSEHTNGHINGHTNGQANGAEHQVTNGTTDVETNGVEKNAQTQGWYDTSAHLVWIGDRTRQIDHAHIEFIRGIENPVGIKVGPSIEMDELKQLLDLVNPNKEEGKVVLISRYGEDKIHKLLGEHIEAVRESGHPVIWQCDPMHGNTFTTEDGIKTRRLSSIIAEVEAALHIHQQHNSFLGGIHLELTAEPVTECTGGSDDIAEHDLSTNYTTHCDPRLNQNQALELAFLVAAHYRDGVSDLAQVVSQLAE